MANRRKSRLDLVLINPSGRAGVYQSLGSSLAAIEPPVWAAMMATFILQKGFSVRIIDGEAEGLTHEEVAGRVAELDPALVTVVVYGHQPSASTQNMPACGAVAAAIKRKSPHLKVLMVGGHVAALPERTLREEQADFVSGDEGLYTILDLLQALRSGRAGDLGGVRGLWFRDGDAVRSNPPAPLLRDLDGEMPGMAWDLLPMDRYRAHNWHALGSRLERQPYAALYTTLGCPYHCSFCCIQAPFKAGERAAGLNETVNSYRFWSPAAVIAQIDTLVNSYGVRNLKIADEMFVLNPKHVLGLCDLIIERGYDLNIWAYARVDTVKEAMLDKLKRAGFHWLAFGIEAASERVRVDVQKGFDQDDIFRTIGKVREAGINVIGNYIFGLPEDDLATMQATLDLAIELNCEFANFYSTMAYPGSPLYDLALRQGWPLPVSWTGYSQHAVDALPLPTKYLPASEVLRFRDHAFQAYFTGERYLDLVAAKFGPESARHIREMTSHKLERRYIS
jgi:radical SAM superfamily enzyme YgiQ (UPF0313 family)